MDSSLLVSASNECDTKNSSKNVTVGGVVVAGTVVVVGTVNSVVLVTFVVGVSLPVGPV